MATMSTWISGALTSLLAVGALSLLRHTIRARRASRAEALLAQHGLRVALWNAAAGAPRLEPLTQAIVNAVGPFVPLLVDDQRGLIVGHFIPEVAVPARPPVRLRLVTTDEARQ